MASQGTLNIAKAFGIITAGLAAGTNLSISFLVLPAMLSPRSTSPKELHAQWKHLYDHGKFTLPPLAVASGAAMAYVAYHDEALRLPYSLAAASVVGILPFTLVGMRSNLAALLEGGRSWGEGDKGRLRGLMEEWKRLNWVRGVMLGVGFGVAVVKVVL